MGYSSSLLGMFQRDRKGKTPSLRFVRRAPASNNSGKSGGVAVCFPLSQPEKSTLTTTTKCKAVKHHKLFSAGRQKTEGPVLTSRMKRAATTEAMARMPLQEARADRRELLGGGRGLVLFETSETKQFEGSPILRHAPMASLPGKRAW